MAEFAEQFAVPFFAALIISFLLTPIVARASIRMGFVAHSIPGRWHQKDTALLGGIAIFCASMASIISFFPSPPNQQVMGWLLGGILVFSAGLADDFRSMRPATKLLFQICSACIVLFTGTSFIGIPNQIIAAIVTIVWIVGLTNAFNIIDNMDGLAAGTAAISSVFIFIVNFWNGDLLIALSSLALMGACLGFLRYNFHPARIFMGDCGSMFLGYSLAVLSVAGTTHPMSNLIATLIVPVFVLGVPIFDTAFVSFSRLFRGQPITQGGKDHTSHRMVVLGLSEPRTVILIYLTSILFGGIALLYTRLDLTIVSVFAVLTLVAAVVFAMFLEEVSLPIEEDPKSEEVKKIAEGRTVLRAQMLYKRQFVELFLDFLLIVVAYYLANLLRFEGSGQMDAHMGLMLNTLPILIIIKLGAFHSFGLYRGIWRYADISYLFDVFKAVSLGSLLSVLTLVFVYRFAGFSRSLFVIDWLLLILLAGGVRLLTRGFKESFAYFGEKNGKRALIIGAGDAGELLLRELRNNKRLGYQPVGFIDDDPSKGGRTIHGMRVLGSRHDLTYMVGEHKVEEVLIAIPSATDERLQEIYDSCNQVKVPYRRVGQLLNNTDTGLNDYLDQEPISSTEKQKGTIPSRPPSESQ